MDQEHDWLASVRRSVEEIEENNNRTFQGLAHLFLFVRMSAVATMRDVASQLERGESGPGATVRLRREADILTEEMSAIFESLNGAVLEVSHHSAAATKRLAQEA